MGVCPSWRGSSPAHFHCQQGADRGRRPLHKLQDGNCHCAEGGTPFAILCYLSLPDCFIGEMRWAEMFNPGNAVFLSTECSPQNERRKKNKQRNIQSMVLRCVTSQSEEWTCPSFLGIAVHIYPPQSVMVLPTGRRALRGILLPIFNKLFRWFRRRYSYVSPNLSVCNLSHHGHFLWRIPGCSGCQTQRLRAVMDKESCRLFCASTHPDILCLLTSCH